MKLEDASLVLIHALIEDLAAGKLVATSQFQLTEDQKNVKIPSYLVYLAGLLIFNTGSNSTSTPSSSLTARDNEQFELLQKIFAESNNNQNEMPIFRLSPRLCPTEDQLGAIQADLERKQRALEIKAREAAQDLLSSTEEKLPEIRTKAKKKKKTSKSKESTKGSNNHKPTESLDETMTEAIAQEENLPPSTLEQIISQIQTETTSTITQDDADAAAWIPVSTKGKDKNKKHANQSTECQPVTNCETVLHNSTITSMQDVDKDYYSTKAVVSNQSSPLRHDDGKDVSAKSHPPSEEKIIDSNIVVGNSGNDNTTNPLVQLETSAQKEQPISNEPAVIREITDPTPKAEAACDAADPDTQLTASQSKVVALEERIQQLEKALKAKEAEVEEEKKANARILAQRQQQFDDHVQALQLRLYISETRLKTFEEALEQHVQAVASNVATTIECKDSPAGRRKVWVRKSDQPASNEKEEPPSPLISRMLSYQKKQKDGTPSDD